MSGEVRALAAGRVDARQMVFLAACLAIFMVSVEATIIATAIPTIVADLGGLRLFSWVFSIYFLTQAVTIPVYGRLADLYGRKRMFVVAVGLFLVGSILSGFARNMLMLILFRGLQGLGAGGVQPVATTIVGDIFSGKERARVQGILSSVWGISAIAGPALGALLIQNLGWPIIFWINVPFGLLCLVLVGRFFSEPIARQSHRIDYAGSLLLAAGVGALMFALVMAGNLPTSIVIALGAIAVVLVGVLVRHELRTPEPMMNLRLLRIRILGIGSAGNFAMGTLIMGVSAFLPTYVQGVLGASAVYAGMVLGTMSLFWTVGAIIGARVMTRSGYRVAAMIGAVSLVAGYAVLNGLDPARGIWWAVGGAALLGNGFGYLNGVFIVSAQGAVGWEQRGAATSQMIFMRQLGQAIGTATLGAVFNLGLYARVPAASDIVTRLMEPMKRAQLSPADIERYAAAMDAALHGVYLILVVVAILALALTFRIPANMRPGDGTEKG